MRFIFFKLIFGRPNPAGELAQAIKTNLANTSRLP